MLMLLLVECGSLVMCFFGTRTIIVFMDVLEHGSRKLDQAEYSVQRHLLGRST